MKKVLLTLIMSVVFGGTIFAQWYPTSEYYNPNDYETYFNTAYEFHPGNYDDTDYLIAYLQCNDELIALEDNWADYEVASFIDGELRGFCFLTAKYSSLFWDWGYEIPMFDGIFVYHTGVGENVTFKVYDHSTGEEFECTANMEVITGEDYSGVYDDPDGTAGLALIISFVREDGPEPQTFTKDITGYGEGDNYWYFIASPVVEDITPSAENGFFTNAYDFFYFDQAFNQEEWRGYDAQNFVVENGKGYLYASNTDTQLSFTGTPYYGGEGDDEGYAEVELTYSEEGNPAWYGWNLVGNPFADDAYVYDERSFYRLEPETGAYLPCTNEDIVPMMEGIFVESNGVDDDMLQFVTATGGAGGGDIKKLVLNVNQGRGVSDRAILRFDGKATLSKLQLKQNSTAVYIPVDGKDYAIVNAPEMGEMPVSFKAESNGSYTLSFTSQEVSFNYLHLIDNMTGVDVDLLVNPSYSFDANTTDYASRFRLVFATGSNSDDNFAFYSNGSFVISNEGNAMLQVVDVTGRILSNETINGSANVHVDAAPGVYMLRLINGDNVKVQKVVVK